MEVWLKQNLAGTFTTPKNLSKEMYLFGVTIPCGLVSNYMSNKVLFPSKAARFPHANVYMHFPNGTFRVFHNVNVILLCRFQTE